MKIVLDTSIRPSCYCYTTRTVCVMKMCWTQVFVHRVTVTRHAQCVMKIVSVWTQCVMKIVVLVSVHRVTVTRHAQCVS